VNDHNSKLSELLADGIKFDPHYLPSMNSDHLPMTLCAMAGLGASTEQLLEFRSDYSKILRSVASDLESKSIGLEADQWRELIGKPEGYARLLSFLVREIGDTGIDPVVRKYLPEFIESLAFAAFHPIIRLGYALEAGSSEEVAASLAYLITTHREMPVGSHRKIDLEAVLNAQVKAGKMIEMKSFGATLLELITQGRYPDGCARDFAVCAQISFAIYRSTRNFFALHMVTATYAVRTCAGYMDESRALAALTHALLGAHLIVGSPGFDSTNSMPVPDRLDLPHAYKYLYVCLKEYQQTGDERYLSEIRGFCAGGLVPDWVAASLVD